MSYADWKRWHEAYLQSPEFEEVRVGVWSRDRATCRACGLPFDGSTPFDVHHAKGYQWVLMPDNEDADFEKELAGCILLCRPDHQAAHGIQPACDDRELLRSVTGY